MLELTAELSKVRMKRKDDPEMISDLLSATKNKYEDAEVLDNETALMAAYLKIRHRDGWQWLLTQDITKLIIYYLLLAKM